MKIGVFDSGIGGQAVANNLQLYFPHADVHVVNDRANLPYGNKSPSALRRLTNSAIQPLLGSDVIVIACNSATSAAIDWLRSKYPTQKFIGIEPMVKPAVKLTSSGVIAVCATPATLASESYRKLKLTYAAGLKVIEPDCSNWAQMIEQNNINQDTIHSVLDNIIAANTDVVVLGCTHYHWIKDFIVAYVGPDIEVLEPSVAIGRRVADLLDA